MLDFLTQTVFTIGRKNSEGMVVMLGTGFLVDDGEHIATSRHVVGDAEDNLCIILPSISRFDEYQDTTINSCQYANVTIDSSDPFRDIVMLKTKDRLIVDDALIVHLGEADNINVGDQVYIIGFPHCVEGRKVLTMQSAMIGSKIIMNSSGIKSKYFVINTQTRPGQSGSIIYSPDKNLIVGMLIGAFASSARVFVAGINPRELHQTTQCISAEYISKMILRPKGPLSGLNKNF